MKVTYKSFPFRTQRLLTFPRVLHTLVICFLLAVLFSINVLKFLMSSNSM